MNSESMNKYIMTFERYHRSILRKRMLRELKRKNRPFRSVKIEPEPINSPAMTIPNPLEGI